APGQLGHGGVDVAHVEVEVVHAAPAPGQLEEAVEERRAGQRLHQLDLAAVGVGELQGAVSGGQVVSPASEVPPAEQVAIDGQQVPDARRGHGRVIEGHLDAVQFELHPDSFRCVNL